MKIDACPLFSVLLLCDIIECKKNENLSMRLAKNTKEITHNKGPSTIEKRSIWHDPLLSDGYL
jgi:hypothetical protein